VSPRVTALGCAVAFALAPWSANAKDSPSKTALADCDATATRADVTKRDASCYPALAKRFGAREVFVHVKGVMAKHADNADISYAMGHLLHDAGSARATKQLSDAIALFERAKRTPMVVRARLLYARQLEYIADHKGARAQVKTARALAKKLGDPLLGLLVEIEEGRQRVVRGQRGDLESGYALLTGALAKLPTTARGARVQALNFLATAATSMGNTAAALEHLRTLAALLSNEPYRLASVRGRLLDLDYGLREERYETGLRDKFIAGWRKVLGLARSGHNPWMETRAHLRLGVALDTNESIQHFERGRKLALAQRDPYTANRIEMELAARRTSAVELSRAVQRTREIDNPIIVVQGQIRQTLLAWRNGKRDAAMRHWSAAADTVEGLRDLVIDSKARSRTFADWAPFYRRVAGTLIADASRDERWRARAWMIGERMRARQLLDTLDAAHATPTAVATKELRGAHDKAIAAVARAKAALSKAKDLSAQLALIDRLIAAEKTARAALGAKDPRYAAARSPRLASLDEARRSLTDDEALLVYQVGFTGSYWDPGRWGGSHAFVVTKKSSHVVVLPPAARVGPAVEMFARAVVGRSNHTETMARNLYDMVIAPAAQHIPPQVSRLTIVADGPLHRAPLAALVAADGRPLGMRFELSRAPSVSALLRTRAKRQPLPRSLLALADANDTRGALPGARLEADAAKRFVGDGRVLLGHAATKQVLNTSDAGVLHFGVHARVSDRHPERSAIRLAGGTLTPAEITKLRVTGALVVLAACESGDGNVLAGEGAQSLARAFTLAGAQAVVASLWPLRDDEAFALFSALYRHLDDGATVAGALTRARRDMQARGLPAASWAGVVVFGDGGVALAGESQRRSRRTAVNRTLAAGLSGTAVLIVGLLLGRVRRRRYDLE